MYPESGRVVESVKMDECIEMENLLYNVQKLKTDIYVTACIQHSQMLRNMQTQKY